MQVPAGLPIELDSAVLERVAALWQHAGLSLGIPGIDAQHVWLVALVLELEWVLHHEEDLVPDRFYVVVEEAKTYAQKHFLAEEQLFKSFNFAEESSHIKSHRKFEETLTLITGGSGVSTKEQAEKLYRFLRKWLIQHILIEDRKYADFLRRRRQLREAQSFLDAANKDNSILSQVRYDFLALISRDSANIDVTTPEVLKEIKSMWNRLNLRIGVPIVDIQHLWLIKMIVDMDDAMSESQLTREAVLARTITEAMDYIDVHFRTEEELLEIIGFNELNEHKKKHKSFEQFVQKRYDEFISGNQRSAGMIVKDLREWLANHIAFEDKQMVSFYMNHKEEAMAYSKEAIQSGRAGIRQNQMNLYKAIMAEGSGRS